MDGIDPANISDYLDPCQGNREGPVHGV